MTKDLLMWDETIFRDPEVFETDFIPEQFNFRENQIKELAFKVKPGLSGSRPLNTICRGLPGTGKTTTIKKLFSEIEAHTQRLIPVHINCQIDNTKFAIFAQIYHKLSGNSIPSSGTSFKTVFDMICRIALERNIVLLICLDDANYLLYEKEINKILYTLLRAHESVKGVRVGIITVISDMDINLMDEVDMRVSSVFRPDEIYFPPYTIDEMKEILLQRVYQGFYTNVVKSDLLDIVVEQTMKAGDLRVGIDLLKRAGINAEMDARKTIEIDDICRAYDVSKNIHLKNTLKTLKGDEREILRLISELSKENNEITTADLFITVKDRLKMGYTRFTETVKKLDSLRIININYKGIRGRSRIITLRYEPDKVKENLRKENTK